MLFRVVLAIVVLLSLALSSNVQAQSSTLPSEGAQARSFPAPPVLARAGVVMDATNGKVLASVNAHLRLPMASTTKVMTALLALQLGDLTDRIKVPAAAFNYESDATVMGLHAGQTVTLGDLLYGLLLPSGADAANTIAIHYGGSEARFIALMNHEAATLGMHDTHYVDATGLSGQNHYTSAYDLAVLGQYVSYIPDLLKVTSTRQYHWNGGVLNNINRVLYWYPGVDGIKPGFTNEAGLCQLIDVQRDGRHIVVTTLNTPNLDTDARNLLNFGLRDYTWVQSQLVGDHPSITQSGSDSQGSYVYFPGAGHYLRGAFWQSYQANGGFTVLGFPRTEPLVEGHARVQYFQNGALSLDTTTGKMSRVPLGPLALPTTPVPTATATPKPIATSKPTAPPREGTVTPLGTGTPPPLRTPTPRPLPTPTTPPPKATATPMPPILPLHPSIGKPFIGYHQAHSRLLGIAVSPIQTFQGYTYQIFAYGAVVSDPHSHTIYPLPLGDRLLQARHWLPAHPANVYPLGFAPLIVLKAITWLPASPVHPKATTPALTYQAGWE